MSERFQMNNGHRSSSKPIGLSARHIWTAIAFAVVASVAVIIWPWTQGDSWDSVKGIALDFHWLLVALGFVVLRDLGYIVRLRTLTRGELGWGRSTSSIVLWELASALTPSVVGGSAVASLVLHRNGLSWGRSLATVMATALLDELYFILAVPLVALFVGWVAFFPEGELWFSGSIVAIFWGGYVFMVVLATLLSSALFWRPQFVHRMLRRLFEAAWLRRWASRSHQFSDDLLAASKNLQMLTWKGWIGALTSTVVSWTARFLTLNAVLMAVMAPAMPTGNMLSQMEIWARQLSMWTIMLISPTPGSSGLAEFALPTFMNDILPWTMTAASWAALALIWRGLTYHLYLLAGAAWLPLWLRRTSASN